MWPNKHSAFVDKHPTLFVHIQAYSCALSHLGLVEQLNSAEKKIQNTWSHTALNQKN